VVCLHVCAKLKSFVIGEFREASDELLQSCGGVNVDEVLRIHLQSVLNSVGVRDDSKHG